MSEKGSKQTRGSDRRQGDRRVTASKFNGSERRAAPRRAKSDRRTKIRIKFPG